MVHGFHFFISLCDGHLPFKGECHTVITGVPKTWRLVSGHIKNTRFREPFPLPSGMEFRKDFSMMDARFWVYNLVRCLDEPFGR
jgi:hypothetical protein